MWPLADWRFSYTNILQRRLQSHWPSQVDTGKYLQRLFFVGFSFVGDLVGQMKDVQCKIIPMKNQSWEQNTPLTRKRINRNILGLKTSLNNLADVILWLKKINKNRHKKNQGWFLPFFVCAQPPLNLKWAPLKIITLLLFCKEFLFSNFRFITKLNKISACRAHAFTSQEATCILCG